MVEGEEKEGRNPGGWSAAKQYLPEDPERSSGPPQLGSARPGLGHLHFPRPSSGASPQPLAPSVGLWGDPAPARHEAQLKSRTVPFFLHQGAQVCSGAGQEACCSLSCKGHHPAEAENRRGGKQAQNQTSPAHAQQGRFQTSSQTADAAGSAALLHFVPRLEGTCQEQPRISAAHHRPFLSHYPIPASI